LNILEIFPKEDCQWIFLRKGRLGVQAQGVELVGRGVDIEFQALGESPKHHLVEAAFRLGGIGAPFQKLGARLKYKVAVIEFVAHYGAAYEVLDFIAVFDRGVRRTPFFLD
jgi:hypothetical protein